jgi:hypothetical protein
MGLSCAWIACEASAEALEAAMAEAFPDMQLIERFATPSRDDFVAMDARVKDTQGQALLSLTFYEDASHGVCIDSSMTMFGETEGLARLSKLVGRTLSLYLSTHGGCAAFEVFEAGQSVRKVEFADDALETVGQRLPLEEQLPSDIFYLQEVDALWAAFGMKQPPGDWEDGAAVRLALYRDHACERATEQRRLANNPATQPVEPPKPVEPSKPWWKFW